MPTIAPATLEVETITPEQARALGYSRLTETLDPTRDNLTFIAEQCANFARSNIPHGIVTLPNGCLQVWRKLGAPLPTEHRRARVEVPMDRDRSPKSCPPQAPASVPELLRQALRLAATRNAYAATQLQGFDTLVLTTAAKEWDRLGFRAEFCRLINTELKRRRDCAAIGRSHLPTAA